ncbi:MAG: serine/threonine-protein kinase [Dehalococcoidia bacterium]
MLAGRYRVKRVKRGGMGEVLFCLDEREGMGVALKRRATEAEEGSSRAERHRLRFELEATTWIGLGAHPNLVQCHYVTVIDGAPALCLEWVTDRERAETSLHRLLVARGPMAPAEALRVVAQVCDGLAHAATVYPGFVHRDLKAENVLIAHDGTAKVTDFGFAQFDAAVGDARLGGAFGQTVGTPATMAPEQWVSPLVDVRADVYAVGCILFRALTGRRSFEGNDRAEMEHAHCRGPVPSLGEGFAAEIEALVQRCLAKSAGERPASPAALASEVREIATAVYGVEIPESRPRALHAAEVVNRAVSRSALGSSGAALGDLVALPDVVSASALHARALAHQVLGDDVAALADFDAAIALEPTRARAQFNRANLLRTTGHAREAIAGYERAVTLEPAFVEAWNNLGLALMADGDDGGAADAFDHAADGGGTREVFANRAALRERRRDLSGAVEDLALLAERGWATVSELTALGRLRRATGDTRGAVVALTAAMDREETAARRVERALAFAAAGMASAAFDDLAMALRVEPESRAALRTRAMMFQQLGRLEEALADFARVVELAPEDGAGYYEMGLVLGESGQFELGLAFIDEAARRGHEAARAAQARFARPPGRSRRRPLLTPGVVR